MVPNAEKLGNKVTSDNDPRITLVGSYLRRAKLDELPQLINVFVGQMSLVGPRPEVPQYVEKWPRADRRLILGVRPGITDYGSLVFSNEQEMLASAGGREKDYLESIMPLKLVLYRRYVRERNFFLDLRILVATLFRLTGSRTGLLLPGLDPGTMDMKNLLER